MSNHLVANEQCPRCYKNGHDRSGDNLGVYSDGHKYCFRCELFIPSKSLGQISGASHNGERQSTIHLPMDSCFTYPQRALEWVSRYHLNNNILLSHRVLWSEERKRLIFPIYGDGSLLGYAGRYFGDDDSKPKWFTKGDLKNIIHLVGRSDERLIIVEDIVSAIRVSKFGIGFPVFGNHVGIDRWKRIARMHVGALESIIWLDPDMHIKIIKESNLGASMGLRTRSILSDKDPKEYTDEEICNILS